MNRRAKGVLWAGGGFVLGFLILIISRELGAGPDLLAPMVPVLVGGCGLVLIVSLLRPAGVVLLLIAASLAALEMLNVSDGVWLGWCIASVLGVFAAALWTLLAGIGVDRLGVTSRWAVALGLYGVLLVSYFNGAISRDQFVYGASAFSVLVLLIQSMMTAWRALHPPLAIPRPRGFNVE